MKRQTIVIRIVSSFYQIWLRRREGNERERETQEGDGDKIIAERKREKERREKVVVVVGRQISQREKQFVHNDRERGTVLCWGSFNYLM